MAAARRKSAPKPSPDKGSSKAKRTTAQSENESPRPKQANAQPESAKLTSTQLETERLAMMECAVKALIVAHPNRGDLRAIFDVLYAEHRAAHRQGPVPTDATVLAMLGALFQTDAESETTNDSL